MGASRFAGIMSAMRAKRIFKSGCVRPNWSWQPARAREQLAKERRDKERT